MTGLNTVVINFHSTSNTLDALRRFYCLTFQMWCWNWNSQPSTFIQVFFFFFLKKESICYLQIQCLFLILGCSRWVLEVCHPRCIGVYESIWKAGTSSGGQRSLTSTKASTQIKHHHLFKNIARTHWVALYISPQLCSLQPCNTLTFWSNRCYSHTTISGAH